MSFHNILYFFVLFFIILYYFITFYIILFYFISSCYLTYIRNKSIYRSLSHFFHVISSISYFSFPILYIFSLHKFLYLYYIDDLIPKIIQLITCVSLFTVYLHPGTWISFSLRELFIPNH